MKFELFASDKSLKISRAALALSGMSDCDRYELFTAPESIILLRKTMTAEQLATAIVSLRMAADDLMTELIKASPDVCDNCDCSCLKELLNGGDDEICRNISLRYKPCGDDTVDCAYDTAGAALDMFAVNGGCMVELLKHFTEGDVVYGE